MYFMLRFIAKRFQERKMLNKIKGKSSYFVLLFYKGLVKAELSCPFTYTIKCIQVSKGDGY